MKYNAHTVGSVTLYKIWGNAQDVTAWELPAGTRVFVLFSPRHNRWVMSISHCDYRYDSFVETKHFLLDSTMLPVDVVEEPAERYYLNRIKFLPKRVA